jgi:hypothetical protein
MFINRANVKEVMTCTSYLVGANANLTCSKIDGEITMVALYKEGWHFVGDISGVNGFMLVFEK